MKSKWMAGALSNIAVAADSYAKKVDKESEPGTFGSTKFAVASLIGAAASAGVGALVFGLCGPGIDRGPVMNAMWTGLSYAGTFTLFAPLAGFASPWYSEKIADASKALAREAAALSESLGAEPPAIDFSKRKPSAGEASRAALVERVKSSL